MWMLTRTTTATKSAFEQLQVLQSVVMQQERDVLSACFEVLVYQWGQLGESNHRDVIVVRAQILRIFWYFSWYHEWCDVVIAMSGNSQRHGMLQLVEVNRRLERSVELQKNTDYCWPIRRHDKNSNSLHFFLYTVVKDIIWNEPKDTTGPNFEINSIRNKCFWRVEVLK